MPPIRRRPLAALLSALALLAACAPAGTTAPPPAAPGRDAGAAAGPLPLKLAPRPTGAEITPADLMTRLYVFADDS
ncbi:MAG TPA: hypothetical protein VF263_18655, partial [Longimicrobiaceae bacterium]